MRFCQPVVGKNPACSGLRKRKQCWTKGVWGFEHSRMLVLHWSFAEAHNALGHHNFSTRTPAFRKSFPLRKCIKSGRFNSWMSQFGTSCHCCNNRNFACAQYIIYLMKAEWKSSPAPCLVWKCLGRVCCLLQQLMLLKTWHLVYIA